VLSQKGSYTIEAAVWVSLLLMMIAMALKSEIFIFTEIVNQGQNEKLQKIDIVQEFYNYQILEEIIQEVTDD
jgi:hypothetical protein